MKKVERITRWFESLDKESLTEIGNIYSDDAFFKDPFNEFNGVNNIRLLFDHMFENLDNPHFSFIDIIEGEKEVFLSWDFVFNIKGRKMKIHGCSLLKWTHEGKIHYHRDYWDVGEELLLKIPVIKFFYSLLRKKLSIT